MACDSVLYHSSFYSLVIPITGSVTAADISTMTITLTEHETGSPIITFTMAASEVTIVAGVIRIIIEATKITAPGIFAVKIDATNTSSKVLKLTPCPSTLQFFSQ